VGLVIRKQLDSLCYIFYLKPQITAIPVGYEIIDFPPNSTDQRRQEQQRNGVCPIDVQFGLEARGAAISGTMHDSLLLSMALCLGAFGKLLFLGKDRGRSSQKE